MRMRTLRASRQIITAQIGQLVRAVTRRATTVFTCTETGVACRIRNIKSRGWRHSGLRQLDALMNLLPKLTTVIAVGRRAARAKALVEKHRLAFYCSAHPSPINRAARPKFWSAIPDIWAEAAARR